MFKTSSPAYCFCGLLMRTTGRVDLTKPAPWPILDLTLWYSPRRTSVGSCIIFSSFNYGYFFIIINDFECCWRALPESVVKRQLHNSSTTIFMYIANSVFLRTGGWMFIIFINFRHLLFLLTAHSIATIKPCLGGQRLGKNRQGWKGLVTYEGE